MTNHILFPNLEIYDGKHFNIHQDWEVPIPGFFIMASKRPIDKVSQFTDEECEEYIGLLRKIRRGMEKILDIKVAYQFQNEDTNHHFHLWIFPRLPWMADFGIKIESVRPIMEHAVKNMATPEVHAQVTAYATKMREYMTGPN